MYTAAHGSHSSNKLAHFRKLRMMRCTWARTALVFWDALLSDIDCLSVQALGLFTKNWSKKFPRNGGTAQDKTSKHPCLASYLASDEVLGFLSLECLILSTIQWLETPSGIFNGEPPLSLKIDEFTFFLKMKADCMSMARTWKNVRRCFSTIKLWKVLERTSSQLYKSIPVRHAWHARATDFYWLYRSLKVHFWCSHHSASASWASSSSKVGSLLGTTRVVSRDKCWQLEMM